MPNRVLREGILTSDRVNALGWAEEVFYRRLMSIVDDYGRYSAHTKLLRAALYPLALDRVSDADVGKWLLATADAGLVSVYTTRDGKRYLELQNFRQQIRAQASKWPAPDTQAPDACAADAKQMPSTCAADAQRLRSEAEAEAEAEAKTKAEAGGRGARAETAHTPPPAWEQIGPETTAAAALATLVSLSPEYAGISPAAFLNAWKIEPDPAHRARAYGEALAALAGKLQADPDPMKLVRAYLRNARNTGAAGPGRKVFQ